MASVTQHVLVRRSHVVVPAQTGATYVVQSAPVQAPPTHTRPPQLAPLFCHVPLVLQLWGCAPLHCT